jgi:hypothetical protein
MAAAKQKGIKASSPKVIRTTLSIDAMAWERLMIHSIKTRQSAGAIVSEAIGRYCRDWGLPADLTARRQSTDSATSTADVNSSEAIAA